MNDNDNIEQHKTLVTIQQSESRLHWQRNNVFLIVSSIFLLAFSQFDDKIIQLIISIGALLLNLAWLLIQHRSSSYIKVWKKEAKKLEKERNVPPIYSGKVKGIQMRHLAYLLPIVFIIVWISLIIIISMTWQNCT